MPRTAVNVPTLAPPLGAYSHAIRAGDFVFVTGMGPFQADGSLLEGEIEEQANLTLDTIGTILEAAGADFGDIVRSIVHLSEPALFQRFNAVYKERFSAPYPARMTVCSNLGIIPGMHIEMDVTAYRPLDT